MNQKSIFFFPQINLKLIKTYFEVILYLIKKSDYYTKTKFVVLILPTLLYMCITYGTFLPLTDILQTN